MVMTMLDLSTVQAFLLVAELQSFTRAAEALGTTQAAVSMKLQRLETVLGKRLVERSPRAVRLTADGAVFADRARVLIDVKTDWIQDRCVSQSKLRCLLHHHARHLRVADRVHDRFLIRRLGSHPCASFSAGLARQDAPLVSPLAQRQARWWPQRAQPLALLRHALSVEQLP